MKGIMSTLLAALFVTYALYSLIVTNRSWDNDLLGWDTSESKLSDLGLRHRMRQYSDQD
jgi:hypothetical protein